MANICILLGESGTGKSTSIKGLNPEETVIINILGKRLPFKGSQKSYNAENKNLFQVQDAQGVISLVKAVSERTQYRNVIIDDASYLMRVEYFDRAKERGFDKFVDVALHTQQVIKACQEARDDLNIYFIYHAEPINDAAGVIGYKVATIGKMLDQTYNPIEVVPVVLFSLVKFDDKGTPSYGFITHRMKDGNVTIPAKSPDGMFEDDFIPNDLGYVTAKMEEYYG